MAPDDSGAIVRPGLSSMVVTDPGLQLRLAEPEDAPAILSLVHAAFAARHKVDPPAAALNDTLADVEQALATGEIVLGIVDGELAASVQVSDPDEQAVSVLSRVSTHPRFRGAHLAEQLIRSAALVATDLGARHLELLSRREFPGVRQMWQSFGFEVRREVDLGHIMGRELPLRFQTSSSEQMQELGRQVATLLAPGDLLVATGELGAGKTTFTQGLAQGLGVEGSVISPTFVLARVHEPAPNRPDAVPLVHVDAYRLASAAELEDLDLEERLADAVTVVEWGTGLVEGLNPSRLQLLIERDASDVRVIYLWGEGPPGPHRWSHLGDRVRALPELAALLTPEDR